MQFELKLVNVEPVPAAAVSTTLLFPANVAVQVEGQVIPAGALVTVPEPLTVTVSPAAPMPERFTVCVLPAVGPLSVMVIVPVYAMNCVGFERNLQNAPSADCQRRRRRGAGIMCRAKTRRK